ncbi:hypothetical protein [Moorena sp. SIO3H5]|uniref:hypothetical protein n=1 Tax=Moorena sp. SIO3H5 TaxID=2607834 RepID=UPI0025D5F4E6|nr:hypothetical protein [Moorena sp. SIO3H5]
MGRWGDGEMGRWGDGESQVLGSRESGVGNKILSINLALLKNGDNYPEFLI